MHFGKALVRGCKGAGADPALWGICAKTACSGCIAKVEPSKTERPSLGAICLLDRVLFCFFISFLARHSRTSFSSKATDCIVI